MKPQREGVRDRCGGIWPLYLSICFGDLFHTIVIAVENDTFLAGIWKRHSAHVSNYAYQK